MRNASISALLITTKQSLLALFAIAVLAACGGSAATALRDTAWELESLTGNDLLPGTTITIEFSGDQVSGSAGCNQYGGRYQAGGNSLSVNDVFSTEMGCVEPEGILEQEGAYLAALRTAATHQIAPDRLEILDEAGVQILVFVTPRTVLVIGDADTNVTPDAAPAPTAEIPEVAPSPAIDHSAGFINIRFLWSEFLSSCPKVG